VVHAPCERNDGTAYQGRIGNGDGLFAEGEWTNSIAGGQRPL
jgi:hypothetical protein